MPNRFCQLLEEARTDTGKRRILEESSQMLENAAAAIGSAIRSLKERPDSPHPSANLLNETVINIMVASMQVEHLARRVDAEVAPPERHVQGQSEEA